MLAVIKTGGKQYLVEGGDVLLIEKKTGDLNQKIIFDQILLLAKNEEVEIGTPFISKGKVEGIILEQIKGPKIKVIKFKRKTRYHRKVGHRQMYTKIKITKIFL